MFVIDAAHPCMAAPASPGSAEGARDDEDERKAQKRAAAEGDQKTPRQKGTRGLLRNGHNEQRRHRDVIGEMDQRVGQVARYIAQKTGGPAGDDHRKHGQNEICDVHTLGLL